MSHLLSRWCREEVNRRNGASASDSAASPPSNPTARLPINYSQFYLKAVYQTNQNASSTPASSSPLPIYLDLVPNPLPTASADSVAPSLPLTSSHPPLIMAHMDQEEMEADIKELGYGKVMIAGASAGVVEHCFMFPVDTIKTRMQQFQGSNGPRYKNIMDAALRITREESVRHLYRGFGATVSGAIPSHAMYFAVYERLSHLFGGSSEEETLKRFRSILHGLAAGCATSVHDAIVTPLDVVKQRLQIYNSSHVGVLQCIRTVYAKEGLRAFYASYPTTLAMNAPFAFVQLTAYKHFTELFTAKGDEHGPFEEMVGGGISGAMAGFVSTPFDVVKTRLQTQEVLPGQNRLGALEMVRNIYQSEGTRGFMRGATARVLYFIPSAAICWTTYEGMKRFLKNAW